MGVIIKRSGFPRPSYEEAVKLAREAKERLRDRAEKKRALGAVLKHTPALERLLPPVPPAEDPEEGIFRRAVRKRDNSTCQFPGCGLKQVPRSIQIIDVHHIGTRKRRPDLIYVVKNGICLCNFKTKTNHHGWVHAHPIEAVEMGLLSDRSYELAAKEGTLGDY